MFKNILIYIISPLIVALIVESIFKGLNKESPLVKLFKKFFQKENYKKILDPTLKEIPKDKLEKGFWSFLKADIDTKGIHFGQFGKHNRLAEDAVYNREDLATKPRMHHTGEVIFLMLKHRDKLWDKQIIKLVVKGINSLLKDNWIVVGLGAQSDMDPDRPPTIVSYRHSIRAIHILLSLNSNFDLARHLLGRMLDKNIGMQKPSGGWAQCDKVFTDEDLWCSSYAVSFLHECLKKQNQLALKPKMIVDISNSLELTLGYLQTVWLTSRWEYGQVSSEENASLIFSLFSYTALEYKKEMVDDVIGKFRNYLDSLNQPTTFYLEKLDSVGTFSASIRLAYSFFLVRSVYGDSDYIYRSLLEFSLNQINTGYNCVDAAQVLDMLLSS